MTRSMDRRGNIEAARRARAMWRHVGDERPLFAVAPRPGEESVWDYPRPPRAVLDAREVVVCAGGIEVARTQRALRVCETASPPTFYVPRADIAAAFLTDAPGESWCEWKGRARYLTVAVQGLRFERAAWCYEEPLPGFEALRGHVGFYPSPLACTVGGARVLAQPGRFYAGWVTPEIVGPFKGEPGSEGW